MAQGQLVTMGPGMQTQVCFSLQDITLGSRGMYLNSETKELSQTSLFFFKKKRVLSIVVLGHCYKARIPIKLIIGGNFQAPPTQILDVDVPKAEENVTMVCLYKTLRILFSNSFIPIPGFRSISLRTWVLKMLPIFRDK